eukprot:24649-Eustigmatos_ZCMA.PRE.1
MSRTHYSSAVALNHQCTLLCDPPLCLLNPSTNVRPTRQSVDLVIKIADSSPGHFSCWLVMSGAQRDRQCPP